MNSDAERGRITCTAEALLAGEIPGPLTVVRLAEAAEVKRWVLTHKHTDLMREFQQRAAHTNRDNPEIRALREKLTALDTENKQLRTRVRELGDLTARYAQVINELTCENAQQSLPTADVIPLRTRT